MWKFISLCTVLLLLIGDCRGDASSDEYNNGEPFDGSSMELYRYYIEEGGEAANESKERVKREDGTNPSTSEAPTTKKPVILLNDLIGKLEGSIVHSALSAVSYAKVSQNSSTDGKAANSDADAPNVKRDALDESIDPNEEEKRDAIFKYVNSRSVSADGNRPARYVIDKVAVIDAKDNLTPLITSLDFYFTKGHEETSVRTIEQPRDGNNSPGVSTATEQTVGKVITDHIRVSSVAPPTHQHIQTIPAKTTASGPVVEITPKSDIGAQKAISDSTHSTPTNEAVSQTSSTSTASPSSSSTTTTKNPIEKLKEAEEDVKEKVAEIEADPVILSARV